MVLGGQAHFYLGIDVGTTSARAAIFDAHGRMRGLGVEPFALYRPKEQFVEQSSDDIWRACGVAVRAALAASGMGPTAIAGIGFDATCSLVVLDAADRPVSVSPTGKDAQNIIVWMDHRATEEAERINATGHEVLRYVGGTVSPEMQTPKLCWLKRHLPDCWRRGRRFLDLPDFLSYRATGAELRSECTTTCKWTYLAHAGGWSREFFEQIGLAELAAEDFARIGATVRPVGERAGLLTAAAAQELGLAAGTPVGVSIIDAHAGGLGVLGFVAEGEALSAAMLEHRLALIGGTSSCHMAVARDPKFVLGVWGPYYSAAMLEHRLALIGGTSSCHMAVARDPKFVPGVWGPYYSAMVPGLWLTEGGQSATGALLDHVVHSHARGLELEAEAKRTGTSVYALLNARLEALAKGARFPALLTRELHVLPDHHGNRSPRADASLRGMMSGLGLSDSVDALALVYYATVQAIAHGTRHILDTMNRSGHCIRLLVATGGDAKNPVFLREHADATGCCIVLPREPEAVLLGAAMLGAVASGDQASVLDAMAAMSATGIELAPGSGEVARYHEAKHQVFQRMHQDQLSYRALMSSATDREIR